MGVVLSLLVDGGANNRSGACPCAAPGAKTGMPARGLRLDKNVTKGV